MPSRVRETVEVDDSVTTYDGDETTLETSMILLSPTVINQAQASKQTYSTLSENQLSIAEPTQIYGNCRQQSYESDGDETMDHDPDETALDLEVHESPVTHKSIQNESPQPERQLDLTLSLVEEPNESQVSDDVCSHASDGISREESYHEEEFQSIHDCDVASQSQNREMGERTMSLDSNDLNEMNPRSAIVKEYRSKHERNVNSIIEKNRKYVKLPPRHESQSLDDRIADLYQYMETEGIIQSLNKLGLKTKDRSKNYSMRPKHEHGQSQNFPGKENIPNKMDEETAGATNASKDFSFHMSNLDEQCSNSISNSNKQSAISKEDLAAFYDEDSDASIHVSPPKISKEIDTTISPIELVRGASVTERSSLIINAPSFQSPILEPHKSLSSKKRMASTSGKKGLDLHRMRLEDETSFHPIYEEFSQAVNQIMNSPQPVNKSSLCSDVPMNEETPSAKYDEKSSFLESALFSQSPISHRGSLSPEFHDDSNTTLEKSEMKESQLKLIQQTETYNSQQAKLRQSSPSRDIPSDHRSSGSHGRSLSISPLRQIDSSIEDEIEYGGYSSVERSPSPSTRFSSTIKSHSNEDESMSMISPVASNGGDISDGQGYQDSFSSKNNFHQNDSIESVDSGDLRDQERRKKTEQYKKTYNMDESIEDDEDNVRTQVSLKQNSRLYYDPLKCYRAPSWAKAYDEKKKKREREIRKNQKPSIEEQKETFCRKERKEKLKAVPTLTLVENPFKSFSSRDSARMEVVFEWLLGQDEPGTKLNISKQESKGKAILMSLTLKQIISLSLPLLVQNDVHRISRHDRHVDTDKKKFKHGSLNSMPEYGGTLIIAKTKESLSVWENSLREMTCFTVFNHAELSSTERRRNTITLTASGFDIVMTTYDALKTKEVSLSIDSSGYAQPPKPLDGWFESKNGESQEGEDRLTPATLSRLHLLRWYRVVCIDDLGRQGYLTKPGTSRMAAISALRSDSRVIFFERSPDTTYFFEDKIKESRRQLLPLAKILNVPSNRTADKLVGNLLLDYRDVRDEEEDVDASMFMMEDSSVGSN